MVLNYNIMSKGNSTRPNSDPPAPKGHRSRISTIKRHKDASERISDREMRGRYNALMGSPECVFFLDLQTASQRTANAKVM